MKKCDHRVYARCPDRCLCGSFESAIFVEGSPCDLYNARMLAAPMTNADRIRAMSDEELAIEIHAFTLGWRGHSDWCDFGCEYPCENGCDKCILKWLQQPAEVASDVLMRPNGEEDA